MKNAQIIEMAQRAAGVSETCHTYNHWRSLGYQVQKGSKALFKATIWKYAGKKSTDEDGEEVEAGRIFMKTASFFGASQVAPIERAAATA